MNRSRTYTLTIIAAVVWLLLCWAFADDQFSGTW
jgi:hypothetical protein